MLGRNSIRPGALKQLQRLDCPAFVQIPGNFGCVGHVQVFQFLNFEAGVGDQICDMPVQVASTSHFLPGWRDTVLPFPGGFMGRFAVFQEQQVASGFEHPFHLLQGLAPVGNGAQGEGE